MQFSAFTRTLTGNTILLKNTDPIEGVQSIQSYSDNSSGSFLKKEIRWSFTGSYWSSWETLSPNAFSRIDTHSNRYLFLEIRYVLSAAGSGNVTIFRLNYTKGAYILPDINHTHPPIETQDTSAIWAIDVIQKYNVQRITDASTLNGYPGSWYLNRAHHTGQQNINTIIGLQNIIDNLNGATLTYVDGSLAARDASIQVLFNTKGTLKGSGLESPWNIAVWYDNSTLTGSDYFRYDPTWHTLVIGTEADPSLFQQTTVSIKDSEEKHTGLFIEGSTNDYFEINIKNISKGDQASSDVVATASNGTKDTGYVDMGINGENYNQNIVGSAGDAYLYSNAVDLLIGNIVPGKDLILFTGGSNSASYERLKITGDGSIFIGQPSGSNKYLVEINGDVNLNQGSYRYLGSPLYTNAQLDASFNQIIGNINDVSLRILHWLKEASIGAGFNWNNGYLDVSGGGDVTKAYVDGSLALKLNESSIGPNFEWQSGYLSIVDYVSKTYVDNSLGNYINKIYFDSSLNKIYISINEVSTRLSSISAAGVGEVSTRLNTLLGKTNAIDSSIGRIDLSLNTLTSKVNLIDGSLGRSYIAVGEVSTRLSNNYVPYTGATQDLSLGNYHIRSVDAISFNTTPTVTRQNGQLFWDASNNTLAFHTSNEVTLQIGQEQVLQCRNATGSVIPNGSVVYVTGSYDENITTIDLAKADIDTTSIALGVTTQDIAPASVGMVTISGIVHDVSTGNYSLNDTLYLSDTTAGAMTNTAVSSPSIWVRVAKVMSVSHTTGSILVNVQAGRSLTTLYDVGIINPQLNETLSWNGLRWINTAGTSISAGQGVTYYLSHFTAGVSTYESMYTTPNDPSEYIEFKVINSSTHLTLDSYISEPSYGIGRTTIDDGIWEFNTFASVANSLSATSQIKTFVYKRSILGVETSLFNVTTGDINSEIPIIYSTTSIQSSFVVDPSDRLVFRYEAWTDSSIDVSINFYHGGTTNYSHVHTPLATLHNDLAGLQGGLPQNYWHLTQADVSRLAQTSGVNTGNQDLTPYALITTVSEVSTRLNDTRISINEVSTRFIAGVGEVSTRLNTLLGKTNAIDSSLGLAHIGINEVSTRLSSFSGGAGVAEVSTRLNTLLLKVDPMDSSIGRLYVSIGEVSSRFVTYDASLILRLNTTDTSLNALFLKTNAIDSSLGKIDLSVNALTAKVNLIDTSIGGIVLKINAIDSSIGGIVSKVNAIDTSLGITFRGINEVSIRFLAGDSEVSTRLNTLLGKVNSIDSSIPIGIAEVSTRLNTLLSKTNAIDSSLGRVDQSTNFLTAKVNLIDISLGLTNIGLGETSTRLNNLLAKTNAIDSSLGRVDQSTNFLTAKVNLIDTSLSTTYIRITEVSTRLSVTNIGVGETSTRLNTLLLKTNAIDSSIGGVVSTIGLIDTSLGNAFVRVGEVSTRLSALYTNVYLDASFSTAWRGITEVSTRLSLVGGAGITEVSTRLYTQITEVSTRLASGSIGGLTAKVDLIDPSLGRAWQSIDEVSARVSGSSVGILTAKVDLIDTSLGKAYIGIGEVSTRIKPQSIGLVVDGGTTAITTGSKGFREIDNNYTITGWTILGDVSGNVVVDVKACSYTNLPNTISITGAEKPTLTNARKNTLQSLTTWSANVSTGDVIEFNVTSADTIKKMWLYLTINPR